MLGRTLPFTLVALMAFSMTACTEASDEGASLAQNTGGGVDASDGTDGTTTADGTDGTSSVDGIDGTDATTGLDGTTGVDGTDAVDSTDAADGTDGVELFCGNGQCDPGEDVANCAIDCGGGPFCGDGTCDDDESNASCPADCGPVGCLGKACADTLAACEDTDGCMDVFNCLLDCETPQCAQQCAQKAPASVPLVQSLVQCGQDNNCFGAPGPDCGNGMCEQGENANNCPADCDDAPGCLELECSDVLEECSGTVGCPSLLQCLQGCETQQCAQGCYQQSNPSAIAVIQSLVECGEDAGCFGGGPDCGNDVCEPGENTNNCPDDCPPIAPDTCSGKCGLFQEGANCQCDEECVEAQDCCDDYQQLCTDGPQCGNGVCGPAENANNCPEDCNDDLTPIEECLDDNCEDLFEACGDSEQCSFLGDCLQQCGNSQNCQNQCFFQVGGQAQQLMTQLLNCGADAGCFDGNGTDCGNGACENGEDANNCPEDCAAQTNSCEGKCNSEFTQGAPCQCDAECQMFGDCCSDFEALCLAPGQCGDGTCNPDETPTSCPADCESNGCILDNCNVGNCLNFGGCAAAIECMTNCETVGCSSACVEAAPGGAQNLLSDVLECSAEAGCYVDGNPICGDGQCEGNEAQTCPADCADPCGNGICGAGETAESCPQDCGGGFNCIVNNCQIGNCFQFSACTTALECMGSCPDDDCGQECLDNSPNQVANFLSAVLECAVEAQCLEGDIMGPICGDQVCEGSEPQTCPADCDECGNEQCESSETPDSCPEDCAVMTQCGNNSCEMGETPQNCPADCGNVDPASCVFASCNAEVNICTEDFSCTLGLQCMDDCDGDADCAFGCASDLNDNSGAMLTAVVECGVGEGCLQ